jgi:hypothetical protein
MNALPGIPILEEPIAPAFFEKHQTLITDIRGLIACMRCQNLALAGWSDLFIISNLP